MKRGIIAVTVKNRQWHLADSDVDLGSEQGEHGLEGGEFATTQQHVAGSTHFDETDAGVVPDDGKQVRAEFGGRDCATSMSHGHAPFFVPIGGC